MAFDLIVLNTCKNHTYSCFITYSLLGTYARIYGEMQIGARCCLIIDIDGTERMWPKDALIIPEGEMADPEWVYRSGTEVRVVRNVDYWKLSTQLQLPEVGGLSETSKTRPTSATIIGRCPCGQCSAVVIEYVSELGTPEKCLMNPWFLIPTAKISVKHDPAEELDILLGDIYSAQGKPEVRPLLVRYKELTGKDKPGFMI